MSYENQILELIRSTPGMRAVQISDRIDLDLDVVEQILLRLVAAGTLTTRAAEAPNGRKVTEYTVKVAGGVGAPAKSNEARPACAPAVAPAINAAPAPALAALPPAANRKPVPGAAAPQSPAAKAETPKPKRQYKRKLPAQATSPATGAFRCALWSDGVLEIRRGADEVVLLTPDEQGAILRALEPAGRAGSARIGG